MKSVIAKASLKQINTIKKHAPYVKPRRLDKQQWGMFLDTGNGIYQVDLVELGHTLEADALTVLLLSNAFEQDQSKIGLFGGFVLGEFPGEDKQLGATFEIEGGGVAVMHYVIVNGKLYVGGIKQPRIRIQKADPKRNPESAIIFNAVRGYLPNSMTRLDAAKMEAEEEAERFGNIEEIKLPPNVWNTATHSLKSKKGFTYAMCEWNEESLIKDHNHYVPNTKHPLVKKALGDSHEKISTGLQFYPWHTIVQGKVPGCARNPNDGLTLVGVLYLIEHLIEKGRITANF